MWKSSKYPWC